MLVRSFSRLAAIAALLSAATFAQEPPHPLNDTGINWCADFYGIDLSCPVSGYPGQDGDYGRDSTNNDDSDGRAGFSFTKISNSGEELPSTARLGSEPFDWGCTRDNVTGALWEVKTNDGRLRDYGWTYTWYDSDSSDGIAGTEDSGICATSGRCDTEKYVEDVNALGNGQGLCGFTDWRMPTLKELNSIVDYGPEAYPAIDADFFPYMERLDLWSLGFWSGSPNASYSDLLGIVNFYMGYVDASVSYDRKKLRLVRGGQPSLSFVDNGDGTVTDTNTGLMWLKCPAGLSGDQCSTGVAQGMTWQQALASAEASELANYADWRLPNVKELQSLVDYSAFDPAVDEELFPNTSSQRFWSASPNASYSSNAWYVDFRDGRTYPAYVMVSDYAVRLVRDGQWFGLSSLAVITTGIGTVTSDPPGIDCGSDCSESYPRGTSVTLTATPADGWQFTGWVGACTGTADCTLTVESALSVTANFTRTDTSVTTIYLSLDEDQRELMGATDTATRFLDFGGQDTYTLSPELAGPIKLIDNQATTVILPTGLVIDAVAFVSNGLRFTINGHPVTLLGAVSDFSFAFGGEAGVTRDYPETATAFGASIPNAGAVPVSGTVVGTIASDGSIIP